MLFRSERNSSATSFVQRWLYFEVLHELFHDLPDFSIEQFIIYTASDCLLTTTTLPALLTAWSTSLLNSKTKWTHLARAQDVLNTARSYILKLDSRVEAGDQTPSNIWSEVEDDAILSIIILGETLTTALRKIQHAQKFDHKDWNILRDQS